MTTKFTPGPWTYDIHEHSFYIFGPDMDMVADGDPDKPGIARMRGVGRGADCEEQEANAAMIAAAPELYEALKALTPSSRSYGCWCPDYRDVRNAGHSSECVAAVSAIKKAENR